MCDSDPTQINLSMQHAQYQLTDLNTVYIVPRFFPLDDPGGLKNVQTPISTSSCFSPGTPGKNPDTVICSLDLVLFYVNSSSMAAASGKALEDLLSAEHGITKQVMQDTNAPYFYIPETSQTIDVLLHILENLTCAEHSADFDTLANAIFTLRKYNISPTSVLVPSNFCYEQLLLFAPAYPLQVYTLAAHFDMYDLAVRTSSHLLSRSLQEITGEMVVLMGATYLKKLSTLHIDRLEEMKKILSSPPHPHPPTKDCDFTRQKRLTRAWMMTAAHFVWEAKCDTSPSVIQSTFEALKPSLTCKKCQEMLDHRVQEVLSRWVLVRRTIQ